MDTRDKIVASTRAYEIARQRPARWFRGRFDPLLAEHARMIRDAALPGHLLIVEIENGPRPLLPPRARAELVAALAAVDYVVIQDGAADNGEAPDADLTRRLIEHVRRRANGAPA